MSDHISQNRRRSVCAGAVLIAALGMCGGVASAADDEPLFTFVHIAHPIVTSQTDVPPGRPKSQQIIARLNATIDVVNRQRPDFTVVTGNLTWSGSQADYDDLKKAVARFKQTTHLAPGPKDLPEGGNERLQQVTQRPLWYSIDHRDCHFVIVGHISPEKFTEFVDWLESDFERTGTAGVLQTIVCGFPFPSAVDDNKDDDKDGDSPDHQRLRRLLKQQRVTAWFGGPEPWGPGIQQPDGVPLVTTPSVSWAAGYNRWSVVQFTHAVVRVYRDRLVVALQPLTHDLLHEVTLRRPPTDAPTAPTEAAYLVDYRADAARKPLLTFVQLSDTQLDDFTTTPRDRNGHRSAPRIVGQAISEVNSLVPRPAFVTITGDLTNKSTDAEWQQYMSFVNRLKMPVHHIPGNHDTDAVTGEKREPSTTNRFAKYTGTKSYYSWQAGGAYFIALDSSSGNISSTQLNWLESELEKSREHRYLFALAHHTIDPYVLGTIQDGRVAVTRLLGEHRAAGFLCGHLHIYACAPLGDLLHVVCNDLCWEDGNGYLIYHLFPDELVACYKPVGQPYFWRFRFPNPRAKQTAN